MVAILDMLKDVSYSTVGCLFSERLGELNPIEKKKIHKHRMRVFRCVKTICLDCLMLLLEYWVWFGYLSGSGPNF